MCERFENPRAALGEPPESFDAEAVAAYADDLRDLPRYEPESAFGPAAVVERDDPYDAYVTGVDVPAADDGPLADCSVAVKDNLAIRGVPMTVGTTTVEFEPKYDATAVERLRRAGAEIPATTNMDPFGFGTTGEWSAHGPTENPVADGRVPGGSSSGSGAAVAGGLVDAALGSDTGGSVRIPASFCGVVGFKPTHRLVPRSGFADLAPSLDHVGVLGEDVPTAARVLETVGGRTAADPSTLQAPAPDAVDVTSELHEPVDGLRVGLVEEFIEAATDEVATTVRDAVRAFADSEGLTVETVSCPNYRSATQVNDAHTIMEFADALLFDGHVLGTGPGYSDGWRAAMADLRARGFPVTERVRRLTFYGAHLLADEGAEPYVRTWESRRAFVERTRSLFDDVDVLATPTTPIPAPAFGDVTTGSDVRRTLQNTAPFNLTGQPCVSVPCGTVDGLPIGLQFTTPAGTDAFAARVARAFERTRSGQ